MLPGLRQLLVRNQPAPPPGALLAILSCLTAVMLVIYVLLPVAFVLFYRSPHVRATCEARDPVVPWTDRCAPPVLAASLLSALGASSLVGLALTYRVLPFFVLLTGLPAALVSIALGAVYAWAAVELYRQRLRGWWVAVGTALLLTISGVVLSFTLDLGALYRAMGYPEEMIRQMAAFGGRMRWGYVVWAPLWLAFLLWVRRLLAMSDATR